MTTIDQVRSLLASLLECGIDLIQPEKSLDDLGMDSLDRTEFQTILQYEMGIEASDDDAARWRTVQDVINYTQNEKGEATT